MANRLTHIYTKSGDDGETSLGNGQRVLKTSIRVECLGNIDELNSFIGLILTEKLPKIVEDILTEVQHDLFNIGGELSIPSHQILNEQRITFLEKNLDHLNESLAPLKEFILPGGGIKSSAYAHIARTICRRSERKCFNLKNTEDINATVLLYLNRLSDLLFVLARYLNHMEGISDTFWKRN